MREAERRSFRYGVSARGNDVCIVSRVCSAPSKSSHPMFLSSAYLENLDTDGQAIPVGGVLNVGTGIDVEKRFESIKPHGKDSCSSLLDSVRVLVLDHVKGLDALSEN